MPNYYLNGSDVMLFLNSGSTTPAPLTYSTSAKITINTAEKQISNRDEGNWEAILPGRKSWSVSSDQFANYFTGTTNSSFDLTKMQICDCQVTVVFGTKCGTCPVWGINTAFSRYCGVGYITSNELSSEDGDTVKHSITIKGTSALSQL